MSIYPGFDRLGFEGPLDMARHARFVVHFNGASMKEFLRQGSPARHMLYSAAWRLGFTVNGLRAAD